MDPRLVRFVVLPPEALGVVANKGDAVLVIDRDTWKYVWAIVGDVGPSGSYRECSISVAWDLGYTNAYGNTDAYGDFVNIYFKGTNFFINNSSRAELIKFFGWQSWYGREPRK